jgi:hypothetical protein
MISSLLLAACSQPLSKPAASGNEETRETVTDSLHLVTPAAAAGPAEPESASALAEGLVELRPDLLRQGRLAGRGPDFSAQVTRDMWASLPDAAKRCSSELLKAQLESLRANARHAERSFRNCQIASSRRWLWERLADFGRSVDANRHDEATKALGDVLATIQAFYTFSNFVELLSEKTPRWDDALDAAGGIWRTDALAVDEPRLLSHYHAAAGPTACSGVAPDLDKSSDATPAGRRRVWNMTAHEAAVEFALEEMQAVLKKAYKDGGAYGDDCTQSLIFGFIPWPG